MHVVVSAGEMGRERERESHLSGLSLATSDSREFLARSDKSAARFAWSCFLSGFTRETYYSRGLLQGDKKKEKAHRPGVDVPEPAAL